MDVIHQSIITVKDTEKKQEKEGKKTGTIYFSVRSTGQFLGYAFG